MSRGLSSGFATQVSTLAISQHTVAESHSIPFMVEQRFCTAAHIKSGGEKKEPTKKKKKDTAPPVPSVSPAGSRPMALLKQQHHTLGKIAVRFVTFK